MGSKSHDVSRETFQKSRVLPLHFFRKFIYLIYFYFLARSDGFEPPTLRFEV
jgi:hypothetical protein